MGENQKGISEASMQKALEAVRDRIRHYGDKAEILETEWQGRKFGVATAELLRFGEHLDRCMGEYFFKPVAGDPDGGQYFCAVITLRSDVPAEQVPELAFALSILNFYLETGCYALNKPTDLLVYRSTRTFQGDTPEDVLVRDCVLLMEEAYEVAAKYCTPVFALAEGSMGIQEFMNILKTGFEE